MFRFFYENGGWPSSFTLEQLHEIRKYTLARLICDNTDTIDTLQIHAFVLPDHKVRIIQQYVKFANEFSLCVCVCLWVCF